MKGGYPLRIDFHTHVFPDKLAEKALTSISEHTGAPYFTNGTVADTDEKLKEWNLEQQSFDPCENIYIRTLQLRAMQQYQ